LKKILLFLLPFLLTGCSFYVELGELDVVENLGIDYYNEEFHITATTVKKEDDSYTYQGLTSSGKTIQEAMENIKIQENKKLYIQHLNLLVLTPNIIKEKLNETMTYFLQNSESRNDFSMALANSINFLEENEEQNFKEMIRIIEEDLGTTKSIQFEEFLKDLLEQGTSFLPTIETKDSIIVNSITLIQKNQQLLQITKEECILYNLLENNIQKANFKENTILSNQTTVHFQKKAIYITINSTLVREQNNFSEDIEEEITKMFQKYREKNIDIFHFNKIIETSNPKFYHQHKNNLLENIELKFKIKKSINISNVKNEEVSLP